MDFPDDFKLHTADSSQLLKGTFLNEKKFFYVFVFSRSGTYYKNEKLGKNNTVFYYYQRQCVCNNSYY